MIAVGTPFFYKGAVDALTGDSDSQTWLLVIGVVGLTVAYGMARLMTVVFQELRDVVFARVGQRALGDRGNRKIHSGGSPTKKRRPGAEKGRRTRAAATRRHACR